MGQDGLHPIMLNIGLSISCSFNHYFQTYLEQGSLPDQWLSSIVVPILKKFSRYDLINYRPISLPSTICQTLEHIIVELLFEYFDINDIPSEK